MRTLKQILTEQGPTGTRVIPRPGTTSQQVDKTGAGSLTLAKTQDPPFNPEEIAIVKRAWQMLLNPKGDILPDTEQELLVRALGKARRKEELPKELDFLKKPWSVTMPNSPY